MMFLIYETEFTVGKSQVVVFTAGNRRDHEGLDTLGGTFPPERRLD